MLQSKLENLNKRQCSHKWWPVSIQNRCWAQHTFFLHHSRICRS